MKHDLCWLVAISMFTGLLWLPYVLERIYRAGLFGAMGYDVAKIKHQMPMWAERCQKAHYNAIEGLVIFVPLVIVAHVRQVDVLVGIQVYCIARVLHYVSYAFAVPVARTLLFFTGVGAQLYIAYQLLTFV
jgi:uncharacterized MAPEG superfamily protein